MLHLAHGLPLLEHVLRVASQVGANPVTVVVGHQAAAVQAAFAGRGIDFILQEPQLGTGHAVQVARESFARSPRALLLVLSGDAPLFRAETLQGLVEEHVQNRAAATVLSCRLAEPGLYGRILRHPDGRVDRIVEARDCSAQELAVGEVNAGVYAFDVPALLSVLDRLDRANAQAEYYLTDVVALLARDHQVVRARLVPDPSEILGVNTMADLAEASQFLRRRRLAQLMSQGVIVEDPATTWIGLDANVAPDAILRPGTILEGRTDIGSRAQVGPFCRLVDCQVAEDAQIRDHCLLWEAAVEAGASIGPFAHIRPGSRIESGAKVGNFVELKKTTLGAGAKAPHLTYLGDATVGPGSNIGAGTITCNYDGVAKHPTRIGAKAFVGSDTTLVAPLTVGDEAYIGAGSTITEDVPAFALALGRSRQVTKPDWVRERRKKQSKPE